MDKNKKPFDVIDGGGKPDGKCRQMPIKLTIYNEDHYLRAHLKYTISAEKDINPIVEHIGERLLTFLRKK